MSSLISAESGSQWVNDSGFASDNASGGGAAAAWRIALGAALKQKWGRATHCSVIMKWRYYHGVEIGLD